MFVTERRQSENLVYLEMLAKRAELDGKEKRALERYRSGFEGEREYDAVLDAVGHGSLYVFRDIWLGIGDGKVQLDALIVADNMLIVNEIKNYSGNYSYEGGVWKVRGRQISEDPVSQVSTAANKLLRLRYDVGMPFEVQKEIIFVNPYLIFGPTDFENLDMFVMRNRLKQYFRSLNNNRAGESAKVLAGEIAKRIIPSPHPVTVSENAEIRRGVNCHRCQSFNVWLERYCAGCRECGYIEPFEWLVVRAAVEFSILYPGVPVARQRVQDLLGGEVHPKKIQRHLKRYLYLEGSGNRAYYKLENQDLDKILLAGKYQSYYEHDSEFIFECHPRYQKQMRN